MDLFERFFYKYFAHPCFEYWYSAELEYFQIDRYLELPQSCQHVGNSYFSTRCLPIIFDYYNKVRKNFKIGNYENFAKAVEELIGETLKQKIKRHNTSCTIIDHNGKRRKRSLRLCLAHIARYFDNTRAEQMWIEEMKKKKVIFYYTPKALLHQNLA